MKKEKYMELFDEVKEMFVKLNRPIPDELNPLLELFEKLQADDIDLKVYEERLKEVNLDELESFRAHEYIVDKRFENLDNESYKVLTMLHAPGDILEGGNRLVASYYTSEISLVAKKVDIDALLLTTLFKNDIKLLLVSICTKKGIHLDVNLLDKFLSYDLSIEPLHNEPIDILDQYGNVDLEKTENNRVFIYTIKCKHDYNITKDQAIKATIQLFNTWKRLKYEISYALGV